MSLSRTSWVIRFRALRAKTKPSGVARGHPVEDSVTGETWLTRPQAGQEALEDAIAALRAGFGPMGRSTTPTSPWRTRTRPRRGSWGESCQGRASIGNASLTLPSSLG